MGYMKYNKRCSRGFKLHIRRFSVQVVRSKFLFMFKFLKFSYGHLLESLKRNMARKKRKGDERREDVVMRVCRLRSFGRSNSFYSEAIADCLEFIKRNSASLGEEKPIILVSK